MSSAATAAPGRRLTHNGVNSACWPGWPASRWRLWRRIGDSLVLGGRSPLVQQPKHWSGMLSAIRECRRVMVAGGAVYTPPPGSVTAGLPVSVLWVTVVC